MNQRNQLKIIAAALCTGVSMQVFAGLGSLQVQSGLGEPFSGSIVVTGEEAKILLNQGAPVINGAPLRASVVRQGNNAVIRLRSNQAIQDPLLSFGLTVGSQGRQYTALLDPPNYRVRTDRQQVTVAPSTDAAERAAAARASVQASVAKQAHPARRTEIEPERSRSAKSQEAVRGHAAASVFAGQRYTVQPQETLMDVARKVQPSGLTLAQTMRALVQANPRAFRNGNPDWMYRGATLNIPTAEQMRRLAKQAPAKVAKPASGQTPAIAPAMATPAETGTSTAVTAAPVASAPAEKPTEQLAPAPQVDAASAPVDQEASMPQAGSASAVETPAVAKPASSAAVVPAAAEPEQVTEETEDGFFANLVGGWLPYALGGLGLLLLLGLLLHRRRIGARGVSATADTEPAPGTDAAPVADEDDDVIFEAAAVPEQMAATTLATAPATNPASTAAVTGQDPVVGTAAEAARQPQEDDDWAWLTQAENEVVAAQPSAAPHPHVIETDWLDEQAFAESDTLAKSDAVAETSDGFGDDDWLKLDGETVSKAAAVPVAQVQANDDFEWLVEADVPVAAPEAKPEATAVVAEANAEDDFAWLDDVQTVAEAAPVAVPASDQREMHEDLTWITEPEVKTEADESTLTPESDDALAWNDIGEHTETVTAKATEPAADAQQRQAFAVSDQDLAVVDVDWDALGLADDSVAAAVETGAQELEPSLADIDATEAPAEDLSSDALVWDEPEAVPETVVSAEAVEPAPPAVANLSVPLEAKLELAKMYLEIDDAQTARKTLQELVGEAEGEILDEARVLLQQLGH